MMATKKEIIEMWEKDILTLYQMETSCVSMDGSSDYLSQDEFKSLTTFNRGSVPNEYKDYKRSQIIKEFFIKHS